MMIKEWLLERGRDFIRWPINLWRDFGVRIGRLGRLFNPKTKLSFGSRLHQIIVGFLDLIGFPEFVEFFFRAVTRSSRLTDEEMEMVTAVLGKNAIRFNEVRVLENGLLSFIFRFNGNFGFAFCHSVCLPTTSYRKGHIGHVRANRPIVMHELTHVYQYEQVGSRYLGEAIYVLIKTKRDCYRYGGKKGLQARKAKNGRFADLNREQQAMLVQNYFTDLDRGEETAVYAPFMEQARNGEL